MKTGIGCGWFVASCLVSVLRLLLASTAYRGLQGDLLILWRVWVIRVVASVRLVWIGKLLDTRGLPLAKILVSVTWGGY